MEMKDKGSTTVTLGIRITGMKVKYSSLVLKTVRFTGKIPGNLFDTLNLGEGK